MHEALRYSTTYDRKHVTKHLWVSFLEGNIKALSMLYHVYYPSLLAYGLRLVHNEELIKDCIQELFLYMCEHRATINPANSVTSYLMRSLRRVVFVHIRREKSRYQRNKQYVDDLPDERDNIEDMLVSFDENDRQSKKIRNAYLNLSKRQQEVVHLKYFEGMTTDEICGLLGLKRQSVYNCLSEAISKLQRCMDYRN